MTEPSTITCLLIGGPCEGELVAQHPDNVCPVIVMWKRGRVLEYKDTDRVSKSGMPVFRFDGYRDDINE